MPGDDLEELLLGCEADLPEAWRAFEEQFHCSILAGITKALAADRGAHTAFEDLVQEVRIKLCADRFQVLRRARREHGNSLALYVKTIAYATAIDYSRRQGRMKRGGGKLVSIEDLKNELGMPSLMLHEVERRLLRARIDEILLTWDSEKALRDRAVFWLYYLQGLTAKEISEIPAVELEVKGVESVIARMVSMIKRRLQSAGDA